MKQLRLKIKGTPVPKQSMKFTKTGFSYQPAKIKKEVVNIRSQVVNQLPENFEMFTGPLVLFAVFIFPEKKTHKAAERKILQAGGLVKKDTHPDNDNLMKQLKDSLQGVVLRKDSQVYCEIAYKGYGKTPGVDIWIAEMDNRFIAVDICELGKLHLCHFDEVTGVHIT